MAIQKIPFDSVANGWKSENRRLRFSVWVEKPGSDRPQGGGITGKLEKCLQGAFHGECVRI